MSKINRGSGVLVVLRGLWRRGSVLEGRVQVRYRVLRPYALPYEVRGARGGDFSSGFVYLLAHGAQRGLVGPASWPDGRITGAVSSGLWVLGLMSLAARKSLYASFLDPRGHQRVCMGKRPVSRGEAPSAFNNGGDEASFTSGVPHHTPPDLAVSAPLLSHTPTPVGSLVKGDVEGQGDDDDKGGGSYLSQYNIYFLIHPLNSCLKPGYLRKPHFKSMISKPGKVM